MSKPQALRTVISSALASVWLAAGLSAPAAAAAPAQAQAPWAPAKIQTVASFEHQVTGVAVTEQGRIFVNFPRWTEDTPVSVAEVLPNGTLRPFPNAEWNAWRNAKRDEMTGQDHWVCVQSVVADGRGNLWVLDPAAPAQGALVPGAPKLVRIDLSSGQVAQTIRFDEQAAPQGSYLNDVRFSPDGRYAYLTDSGARGALLVVDLAQGKARRVLDGHSSTQVEKGVAVKADGKVLRRPDGRGVEFAADGIALSNDGSSLYWQAIKGRTLYRIDTAALQDAQLPAAELAAKVERVGDNGPADGLWMDAKDRLYISAIEEDAVKIRHRGQVSTWVRDARLRWPDSFAQGPDGSIYVTSSRIQDMNYFKPDNPVQLRTTLLRLGKPD